MSKKWVWLVVIITLFLNRASSQVMETNVGDVLGSPYYKPCRNLHEFEERLSTIEKHVIPALEISIESDCVKFLCELAFCGSSEKKRMLSNRSLLSSSEMHKKSIFYVDMVMDGERHEDVVREYLAEDVEMDKTRAVNACEAPGQHPRLKYDEIMKGAGLEDDRIARELLKLHYRSRLYAEMTSCLLEKLRTTNCITNEAIAAAAAVISHDVKAPPDNGRK